MTDGTYLGPDYRFTRRRRIEAFIWGEPEGHGKAWEMWEAHLVCDNYEPWPGEKDICVECGQPKEFHLFAKEPQYELFSDLIGNVYRRTEDGEVYIYCPEEST